MSCIQENNLQNFYPPTSPVLDRIAQRASTQIDQVCQRWRLPKEVGSDLAKLGLFDIILYIGEPRDSSETVTCLTICRRQRFYAIRGEW